MTTMTSRANVKLLLVTLAVAVVTAGDPLGFKLQHASAVRSAQAAQATADQTAQPLCEDVHVVRLPKKEYGYRGMPGDVEVLKDGRVVMLTRSYSRFVGRAYSADRGQTWSKGEQVKDLPLPPYSTSALNVKRIPKTGDLLLLRCIGGPKDPPRRRTPFGSIISKDDGQTWTNQRVLAGEPDNDYGYPSLTFVDDIALIIYHQRDGLHLLRVGVDWFYGK